MMNFEEFTNMIVKYVSDRLEDVLVTVHPVKKNNGVELQGLIFRDKGNMSPTIYIDSYYRQYEENRPLADIVDDIVKTYQDNKLDDTVDTSFFTDFTNVKSCIICNLVNYERNKELLEDIPHYRFLDLAIVFKVHLNSFINGMATVLIHNNHLAIWNISKETLRDLAIVNTPRIFPYTLTDMGSLLGELLGEDDICGEFRPEVPMYVLSNNVRMHGAVSLLYNDVLKELSNRLNTDLCILPSSVHETIILPVSGEIRTEEFCEMVREVNTTQLSREEILSDHVYYYVRESNEIIM